MELKDIVKAGMTGGNDEAKAAIKSLLSQRASSLQNEGRQFILASMLSHGGFIGGKQ